MESVQPKRGRPSAVTTCRAMIRPGRRSAIQAIVYGAMLLAVCLSLRVAPGAACGAMQDRLPSASPGCLAGRTSVPSADQPGATPEPSSTPGQAAAHDASRQPDLATADQATPAPGDEPEASQRSPDVSAKKATPSPHGRSSGSVADWAILLSDEFDDNARSWDVGTARLDVATMSRTVADGTYNWDLDVRESLLSWSEPASGLLTDFYAAVDASLPGGTPPDAEFGLSVRSGDLDDMLLLLASPARGVTLLRGMDNSPQVLVEWTPTDSLRAEGWNRLAISSADSQVTLYVNDQQVAQVTAKALSDVQLGIAVRAGEAGHSVVQFDNFEVRPAPGSSVTGPGVDAGTISPPSGDAGWAKVLPENRHTAPPDWPIVFWEAFDDNGNGWATGEEFNRQVEASRSVAGTFAWQFKALQPVLRVAEVPHPAPDDFYAAVDVKRYSGPEDVWYGLAVLQSDPNRTYCFLVNDDRNYRVSAFEGDTLHQLVDSVQSETIRRGGPNNLGVMAEETRLAFFVNSQPVIELEFQSHSVLPSDRTLGLALGLSDGDAGIIEFDNFELRIQETP